MALRTVLESLDDVQESHRDLYAETEDGNFVLQVEGVDNHPEVANLRNAYQRTKADRDAAKAKLTEAEARLSGIPEDFDPQKWEQAKKGKRDDDGDLVKLRQTLEAERDEWKGKYEQQVERGRRAQAEAALTDALTRGGVNPDLMIGARAVLMPKVTMADTGPVVESDMGPMALADYAKRWLAGEGKAFVSKPQGGGASGGDKSAGGKKWGEMTGEEKVALHRSNPQEYQRLKAAG